MKKCLLILSILLFSCTNQNQRSGKTPTIPTNNTSTYESNTTKSEQLADPLILDGRPFVGYQGKAYRKDEAELITSLTCNFNSDATVRWHSLEGVEQLVNLKSLSVFGEDLNNVDFSLLSPLSNLKSLYFRGITRLPDLTMLEQISYINIKDTGNGRDSRLKNFEGIGAPNVNMIDILNWIEIDSYAPLNNLHYLEKLVINSLGQKVYKIADISNLPRLKNLQIITGAEIDLQGIEGLLALENISLSSSKPFNIESIGKLKNLKHLDLKLIHPEPSLEFLRDMPNLSVLYLTANENSNYSYDFEPYQVLDVSPLATLKNLRMLGCTDFIIKNIATLDVLDALSIQDDESPGYIYLAGSRLFDNTEKSKHPLVLEHPVK
ncbi:MAG: hypothetical protein LBQ89_08920 [Treponema sp.]|jgi:hypothetical protein|nr:hypothetical protein [Treponema sp.]